MVENDLMDEEYLSEDMDVSIDLEEDEQTDEKLERMIKSKKFRVKESNPKATSKEHSISMRKRDGKTYYICDNCGAEAVEGTETKIYKGRNQNYAYCPKCTKELYPCQLLFCFYLCV